LITVRLLFSKRSGRDVPVFILPETFSYPMAVLNGVL